MRKILIGLMIIGFLLCLVRVGTWAFFSDTETSKGEEYLTQILYEPVIGNIEAGGVREFSLIVELNENWSNAPDGEEVKLKIEVTREDNWPEHNIGRKAHFTIIKGGG